MLSHFMAYLQFKLGAHLDALGQPLADTSWSAQLQGSERLWMLLEGAHVLTLMLFVGTILFVDLRLLGLAFRGSPVSKVTDTLLPYTVIGFSVMVITGLGLFYAKPFDYYHNFLFRVKVGLVLAAAINIFLFHYRVQANREKWDGLARPPVTARAAAALSLLLWVGVVTTGRYVAYSWTECANAEGLVATVAECGEHDATLAVIEPEMAS
jgi:hypothetical protein